MFFVLIFKLLYFALFDPSLLVFDGAFDVQGSGWGSLGKAVASDTRRPWFEYSHQQNLY